MCHLLPKVYCALDYICWPLVWPCCSFERISAAIDCTPHYRQRVHPRQGDYYRGDKHGHFLNAQVVCALSGPFYNIQLLLGHNNDQGSFNITGMKRMLEELGLYWAADSGYSHHCLVCPDDERSAIWNQKQKSLWSVVETVIGLVKVFRIATEVFRLSPEKQELALICVYQLTNLSLLEYPLRPNIL